MNATDPELCTHPPVERYITRYTGAGYLNVPTGDRLLCRGCGLDFYDAVDHALAGYPTAASLADMFAPALIPSDVERIAAHIVARTYNRQAVRERIPASAIATAGNVRRTELALVALGGRK